MQDTEVVFPAAAKLFGGQHTGDGFQIPFQAPDCGTLDLTVEVDGPLADYMQALDGSLGLVNGTYTVSDGGMLNLGARLKAFNEMSFEGGVAYSQLEKDRLYGTKLKLTGVYTYPDGSTETRKQEIYLYRWLEVVAGQDASVATGRTAAFHEKADGSLGKFVPSKEVDLRLPVSVATKFQGEKSEFVYGGELTGNRTAQWNFQKALPVAETEDFGDVVEISANGVAVGEVMAGGSPPQLVVANLSETITLERGDDSSFLIPLGFNFEFYGRTYANTTFYVNQNGNITLGQGFSKHIPNSFPQNLPMIAPFWADVDTSLSYSNQIEVAKGNNLEGNPFIQIDWSGVAYFGSKDNGENETPDKKLNDFSLYIENDPVVDDGEIYIPGGDWIAFSYGDMQWTTGDADPDSLDNGFEGIGALVGFSGGQAGDFITLAQPKSQNELNSNFDNTSLLFRIGEDGKPKLMLGYDGTKAGTRFEQDPMREELGVFRYVSTIYRTVESYNQHLAQLVNTGKIQALPAQPLDWRWVVAQMMQESTPSAGNYDLRRKYDPLQTSNDEEGDGEEDSSILTTVRNGRERTDILAIGDFRQTASTKAVTLWSPSDLLEYEPFTNSSNGERMDAKTGIELGVIGLLYKSALSDNNAVITEWRSWKEGTINYNGNDEDDNENGIADKIDYEASIRNAYNNVFSGWWNQHYEKPLSEWKPDLKYTRAQQGNPTQRQAWEGYGVDWSNLV